MHKEIFCSNSRGWVLLVQFQLRPLGGDDQTRPFAHSWRMKTQTAAPSVNLLPNVS